MEPYQPNGVISLSTASMEFSYPDLSIKEYEDLSNAFTATGEGSNQKVSYKGKGLRAAQATDDENGAEKPIYILASYDGKSWYYYERYLRWASLVNEKDINPEKIDISGFDFDTYFSNTFGLAYFGITTINPTAEYEIGKNDYFTYTGGLDNVHEISAVSEAIDFDSIPPYIITKRATNSSTDNPYSSRLDQGVTYDVTVIYNETLKQANTALSVDMMWVQKVNGASFTDFKWWGADDIAAEDKNAAKVTFQLTTGKNFGNTTNYYFEITGLVGTSSGKAPNAIGFSTYNNNIYDCPKVDWDINKIHSKTPALVANEDISTEGWTDANGNTFTNLPTNFSLVATTIEDQSEDSTEKSDMIKEIEKTLGNDAVKSAQTYDISLSLCSNQVAFIQGKPLQVYVPFPAGYTYENFKAGTAAFKAYHFDADGNPEEINCKVVQGGIIMYCSAFSPYAVVAMDTAAHSHESEALGSISNNDGTHNEVYQDCGALKEVNIACSYGEDNICDACGYEKKAEENPAPTPTPNPNPTPNPSTSTGGGFYGSYNYPVSTPSVDNGSVKLSDNNAAAGETVTITVGPDNGYGLETLIITDEDGNVIPYINLGGGKYSFTMPAGKVNITTEFAPAITLTIGSQAANVFGKTRINDAAPIITEEGRTMLPIRFIAEALGATVEWNEETQTVTIMKDGVRVEILISADYAYINGKKVNLDAPAFIQNGRTYLPLRFVAEALGADVNWDAATRQIVILK